MPMTRSESGKLGADKAREYFIKLKSDNIAKYLESPKKCRTCNKIIDYEKRANDFCNHKCAARTTNTFRTGRYIKKPCLNCGHETKNTFCSKKCQTEYQRNQYTSKWISGEISGSAKNVPAVVRMWLYSQRGAQCWVCGWKEVNPTTGKVPIQIDHINGDALNNRPDNLRLICPNCHSLTPTFGGLNRGKGRAWRYKKNSAIA